MKAVIVKAHEKLQVGDQIDIPAADFAVLAEDGIAITASEWESREAVKANQAKDEQARKDRVDQAIVKATTEGRFLPKENTDTVKANALKMEAAAEGTGILYIGSHPVKAKQELTERQTTSAEAETSTVEAGEAGFADTIKGYLRACQPFQKSLRNGGIVRVCGNDAVELGKAVELSRDRAIIGDRLAKMIVKGADMSRHSLDKIVKAGDYVDPAGSNPLGVLNTGMLLQWNLGFLKYQLALLNDISTDITGQPVLFNQMVRTRYMKLPGLMLKSSSNAWPNTGSPTGTDVDVNVTMDTHAGVPISINNNILSATPRQLFNEQRQPQLTALAQYITYKLIYAAYNGTTRYANDGTTTSTKKFSPGYTGTGSGGAFNVAGASLRTFVADLPEAMDEARFPGGDEDPGDENLQRFAWVHGRVYAAAAADTNFLLNQSIWGAVAKKDENLVETGRYSRLGNIRLRKSQLVTDQCALSATDAGTAASPSGADATTNAIFVTAGDVTKATNVGIAGTKSALLFVSRVPTDYTKILSDVPSTAAIELVTEPSTGLTFMVVKFLDHMYETANMRVQLMFGVAVGDERQGMYLSQV